MNYWCPKFIFIQDAPEDFPGFENTGSSGVVDINTTSAVLFVVIASCFLILLYKFMSFWFVEILVVLFCIGGVEVCASFPIVRLFIFYDMKENVRFGVLI